MSIDRPAPDDGFTLLETLVALVIATIALLVMFQVSGEGLFATRNVVIHEAALGVAQSRLALARARPVLRSTSMEGNAEGGLHWREDDVPVAISGQPQAAAGCLFRITVTVTWNHGVGQLAVSTLTAAPMHPDGTP